MFRFKQFTIQQDRTAMKVCTDACVLGAYADIQTGDAVSETDDYQSYILDIGTGTGLLALMAAQRNPRAVVDAIEVDTAAYGQAVENAAASPFAGRVRVIRGRIQTYRPAIRYDRIIANPPFYTNHLRSPDEAVNRALHTDELPFDELVDSVVSLLKPTGQWWVLLPPAEMENLSALARQAGLTVFRQLHIRHNARKPVFRVVAGFGFQQSVLMQETLVIHERIEVTDTNEIKPKETYSSDFRALLQEFYLIF